MIKLEIKEYSTIALMCKQYWQVEDEDSIVEMFSPR